MKNQIENLKPIIINRNRVKNNLRKPISRKEMKIKILNITNHQKVINKPKINFSHLDQIFRNNSNRFKNMNLSRQ
jgi:hypothetical protein